MQRAVEWVRWELSRRIDMTAGVRLIVLDRGVKAVALTIGGIALLIAERRGVLATLTTEVQEQLNLSPGSHLWLRLINAVLQRFGSLSGGAQIALAIALLLYALLETVEAVGLLARRRWAEYLVLMATLAFIPLEVDELFHHVTVLKALAFAVNVAIAVYLIWRKRLFWPRPSDELEASVPRPAPVAGG